MTAARKHREVKFLGFGEYLTTCGKNRRSEWSFVPQRNTFWTGSSLSNLCVALVCVGVAIYSWVHPYHRLDNTTWSPPLDVASGGVGNVLFPTTRGSASTNSPVRLRTTYCGLSQLCVFCRIFRSTRFSWVLPGQRDAVITRPRTPGSSVQLYKYKHNTRITKIVRLICVI